MFLSLFQTNKNKNKTIIIIITKKKKLMEYMQVYTKRIDIVELAGLYSNLSGLVRNGKKGLINIYGIPLGNEPTGELDE